MPLTYRQAKEAVAQYARTGGLCVDDPGVDSFLRQVLEVLLISGSPQDLRKYVFTTNSTGQFTLPPEIESIQKVKIDGRVGNVWDKWFEYHNSGELYGTCIPPADAVFEEINYYPTAYDVPLGGASIGVQGTCDEQDGAHVIVQGLDLTGREIYTNHQGTQIDGVYLSIKKGILSYSPIVFSQVTAVKKSKTTGYVQLLWTNLATNKRGFLSDYSPLEELPQYRRYKLTSQYCNGGCHKVSVLARIKLKEAYSDNDMIPFDTLITLVTTAQTINASYNSDGQSLQVKSAFMEALIEKDAAHRRVNSGQPINFAMSTSPGLIRNPIGGFGRYFRRTW